MSTKIAALALWLLLSCIVAGCMANSRSEDIRVQENPIAEIAVAAGTMEDSAMQPADYSYAINHPGRTAADFARDASSRPAAVLSFMNIRPGQTVLDFQAGAGYFSELLSYAVGESGKVYAHNHSRAGAIGPEVFEQRYGSNRLPNTELMFAHHNDLELPAASLDAVLMSMVYHDTYWFDGVVDWGPVDHQAFLATLYNALKPGGVILVIDHQAEAGADPYESAMATHRIDRAIVLRDFAAAGFVLQAESDLLRNPADAYELQIFEEAVYRNTDRFMLLFAKPL
jgi:predicted methyltransferase